MLSDDRGPGGGIYGAICSLKRRKESRMVWGWPSETIFHASSVSKMDMSGNPINLILRSHRVHSSPPRNLCSSVGLSMYRQIGRLGFREEHREAWEHTTNYRESQTKM